MVIREAESREDDALDSAMLRERCENALLAMSPAELAERVATVMDTETLFYLLTGQIVKGYDYLDAMDNDELAKFAGVEP